MKKEAFRKFLQNIQNDTGVKNYTIKLCHVLQRAKQKNPSKMTVTTKVNSLLMLSWIRMSKHELTFHSYQRSLIKFRSFEPSLRDVIYVRMSFVFTAWKINTFSPKNENNQTSNLRNEKESSKLVTNQRTLSQSLSTAFYILQHATRLLSVCEGFCHSPPRWVDAG